jgi:methylated-DNA-[protein]-cysteine S-methyltransferase
MRRFPRRPRRRPPEIRRDRRHRRAAAREKRDLRELVLDMDGVPSFNRRVYELPDHPAGIDPDLWRHRAPARRPRHRVPWGGARAQPLPIVVPCHRVLAADGGWAFSAPGGVVTKRRMLEIEGVEACGLSRRSSDPAMPDQRDSGIRSPNSGFERSDP